MLECKMKYYSLSMSLASNEIKIACELGLQCPVTKNIQLALVDGLYPEL